MLPLSGTLQLTAAYVPVIWFPATVAVTWKGQLIGTLGVSVIVRLEPFRLPLHVPSWAKAQAGQSIGRNRRGRKGG